MESSISLYLPRDSGLHRLHPLTKLAFAGATILIGLILPGWWGTYLLFVVIILPAALWGQVASQLLNQVWKVVLPFAVSVTLIQGFFWGSGTPLFTLGPLSMKLEGLRFAAASTGRILTVVSSFLLLSLTTRPDSLMLALSHQGLPSSLTYIVLSTIQIIPQFQARADTILDAQRSRGLETGGSILQRARNLLPLAIPLVLGSIVDIEQRAIALEARAFSKKGPKSSLIHLVDSPRQRTFRWGLAGAVILVLAWRLGMAL